MPFYQEYPIDGLTPAPYNPRHLDDSAFTALQRSIRVLGMIKPVIIADNGTIVAGHQRSRAARAVGLTHVPVFVVHELNIMNEMKFNQLHNGTEDGRQPVRVASGRRSLRYGAVRVRAELD